MRTSIIIFLSVCLTYSIGIAQNGNCGGVEVRYTNEIVPNFAPFGPFNIHPEYNENISNAQELVIEHAVEEWNDLLESNGVNPSNYEIKFRNGSLSSISILAKAITTYNTGSGNLVRAEVIINDSPLINWYIDSTPESDSEFNDDNSLGIDFLSVIRHEIGHAVGWVKHNTRIDDLVNIIPQEGLTFDEGKLHIGLNADTSHTSPIHHPNDLMNPGIWAGIRRDISLYPNATLLSKAFQYEVKNLRCVHSSGSNTDGGHVFEPWKTFEKGVQDSPSNFTLLLLPGTYIEDLPLTREERLFIMTTRAGSAIVID